ncbi:MAG TPA: NHLP leader peptide family RiPP precursor [Gemmataceae bacterium]|jgi:hypothetical protein|nr:NHLP leader peptide family RiPP precursor [Gemmataceae bacterium]
MVLTLEREPTQTKWWAQLVARAWEDEHFKRRLLSEPAAVLEEEGIEVPPGREVRVAEDEAEAQADGVVTLTLPAKPRSEDLVEEDLSLAGQPAFGHWPCIVCWTRRCR